MKKGLKIKDLDRLHDLELAHPATLSEKDEAEKAKLQARLAKEGVHKG